jgi:hypothetical protein
MHDGRLFGGASSRSDPLEVAQIVGNIDVIGHRIVSFTTFPSSLHHVGQDFSECCDSVGAFGGNLSYVLGRRVKLS